MTIRIRLHAALPLSAFLALTLPAAHAQQPFQGVDADDGQVPARLFQSIAQSLSLVDRAFPYALPYDIELGTAWLEAADHVGHMNVLLDDLVGLPGTPPQRLASLSTHMLGLEESMLLIGGDLLDGRLDEARGPEECAKALGDLAADFGAIDRGFGRAVGHLRAASEDLSDLAILVDSQAMPPELAREIVQSFYGFHARMKSVSEGLMDPGGYSAALDPPPPASSSAGGVAGGNGCPPTHPYRSCTTFWVTYYVEASCTEWIVLDPSWEFGMPYGGDVYRRVCIWTTRVEELLYCVCYASEFDRLLGRNPHGDPVLETDIFYDFDLTTEQVDTAHPSGLGFEPDRPPTADQAPVQPDPLVEIF